MDSSVWTCNSSQQGAERGYIPKKRGRNSHHPLMAFVVEMKMAANFWLRPGNTSSANNVLAFLQENFEVLTNKMVGLLRADSGFYSKDVMDWLEQRSIDYIIAIKMYPTLKLSIRGRVSGYEGEAGVQLGEFWYKAEDWSQARRIVVVRQHIKVRPKTVGKLLFTDEEVYRNYRYSAFVTNLKSSAERVWELYRKRADCENRIKELEYDF